MSDGNTICSVRLDDETLDRIDHAIARANKRRKQEPYNVSTWIRHAIQEKLDHINRGNCVKRKRNKVHMSIAEAKAFEDQLGPPPPIDMDKHTHKHDPEQ